jgi:hypothetical protein
MMMMNATPVLELPQAMLVTEALSPEQEATLMEQTLLVNWILSPALNPKHLVCWVNEAGELTAYPAV